MLSPTVLLLAAAFLAGLWFLRSKTRKPVGPPGPWGLPLLGNLHQLGDLPQRSLEALSKTYGPIMQIRLGLVPTVVVSSPEAAELFLKTHDLAFCGRPNLEASKYLSYERKGLVFAPYGAYWRNIRKFCTLELLSGSKIESFKPVRKEEVTLFVKSVKAAADSKSTIDVSAMVGSVVEDMTYRMVFGFKGDLNLKNSLQDGVELTGVFNVSDYIPIPFLGALDLQGLRRRLKQAGKEMDDILEEIINQHVKDQNKLDGKHRDFIDIMLTMLDQDNSRDEHLGRDNIKAILLDMLAAGIDTSTTVVEWTVSELLRNPRAMKLIQEEVANVVGLDRMVDEEDLGKLKYMKMVVKESLRLHPVIPLLTHQSIEDRTINGYFIPSESRITINTWAIGRDPKVWGENVLEFYPERFADSTIGFEGHDFELLPFGAGRRKCPGLTLGNTVVELVLAQLVHCFNLELPAGISPEKLDMKERFGLSLPRADHLHAVPTYRLKE